MHFHPTIHDFPDFDLIMTDDPIIPQAVASSAGHRRRVTADDSRLIAKAASAAPRHADDSIVVCGRGKGAYNRPGNKRFRALIRSHLASYMGAANKFQKGVIIQRIAQDVQTHGLVFVRKSADAAHQWSELDAKERRDKIGHAIREAVAEQKSKSRVTRPPKHLAISRDGYEARQPVLSSSDSVISLTPSIDESDALDQDLEDRRIRFDRMLESFRSGRGGGCDETEPAAIEPESYIFPAIEPDFSTSLSFYPV
ncbi:hypothetical protein MPSEU_000840200 [Mayamaea pseudoterrestris]|nr:hypothetical protein MPSEU_000840200 [Mayamaea pseudoterrestris]